MSDDPYQPPAAPPIEEHSSIEIRKEHLAHEGTVRFVGWLVFGLGTLFVLRGCFLVAGAALFGTASSANTPAGGLMAILVGVFFIWLGLALSKLELAGHKVAIGLSVLALAGFPVGTAIGICLLYLFVSRKGSLIFSRRYQTTIAETPELRARPPMAILILAVIGLLAWIGAVFSDFF